MSNILDDILSNMDKPPTQTPDQRRRIKQASENIKHVKQREKEALHSFKKRVQELIGHFISNTKLEYFEFEPLDRPFRTIIYDVAEVAGVIACSYGEDEVDRYTVIYRKDCGPTEDERSVRNNGGKWNAAVCAEMKKKREIAMQQPAEPEASTSKKGKAIPLTGPDYRVKYSHISITPEKTSTNCNYGEVPSSLKRDVRSIEQTLSDLKAKRLKTSTTEPKDSDTSTAGTSSLSNYVITEVVSSIPPSFLNRLNTDSSNEHLAVAGPSGQQQIDHPGSAIYDEEDYSVYEEEVRQTDDEGGDGDDGNADDEYEDSVDDDEDNDSDLDDFTTSVNEHINVFKSSPGYCSLQFPEEQKPSRNDLIVRLARNKILFPVTYGVAYINQYVVVYKKKNGASLLEKTIRWSGGDWNAHIHNTERSKRKLKMITFDGKNGFHIS